MNFHPLICPACREYAAIPGGCECPEVEPEMAEIEHQPVRDCMTGPGLGVYRMRGGFVCDALDAPWALPIGGVRFDAFHGTADCAVERERDDDAESLCYGRDWDLPVLRAA